MTTRAAAYAARVAEWRRTASEDDKIDDTGEPEPTLILDDVIEAWVDDDGWLGAERRHWSPTQARALAVFITAQFEEPGQGARVSPADTIAWIRRSDLHAQIVEGADAERAHAEMRGLVRDLTTALADRNALIVERDAARTTADEEVTALRAQLTEHAAVLRRVHADLASERDRRVAAQEAITGHWEPKLAEADTQLRAQCGLVAQQRAELNQLRSDLADAELNLRRATHDLDHKRDVRLARKLARLTPPARKDDTNG